MENENLKAALHYADIGFSVIPIMEGGKTPLIEWKEYQTRRATKEEIEKWFKNPDVGVGIVTGAISGIVVVDIEAGGTAANLPPTVISKTGGGGWHFFYKHPGVPVKNAVRFLDKTDIRADGGYVVAPPSLHSSGNRYEWSIAPENSAFEELPRWVLERVQGKDIKKVAWSDFLQSENPEGNRNERAAILSGKILHHIPIELWESLGWSMLQSWNASQNKPPLEEKELRAVWESIKSRETAKRGVEGAEGKKEPLGLLSLGDLMRKEFPDMPWLAKSLIPHEAITVISGAPASYKTWLTLTMTLQVATGASLFDTFETSQSPVLIVDEENGERLLQQRMRMLSETFEIPVHIMSLKNFRLDSGKVNELIKLAKGVGARVIIFDSLIRIHGADENDASKMAAVFKYLKEITKNGIAVIVTHHNRKQGILKSSNPSQDMRGSSDILASVDCHIAVERKQKEDYITITQTKLRQGEEIRPFKLNVIAESGSLRFEYAGEVDEKQSKKADLKTGIREILEKDEKPIYKTELFELLKDVGVEGGYSTFKSAVQEMVKDGELFEKKGLKNKVFCSLKEFGADDG